MDVVVDSAPAGERARYNLAKALSQLDAPAPTFSNAQQAISIPHAVLMDGVTRETGRRLMGTVKENGGRASMAPHVEAVDAVEEPGSFTNFLVVMLLVGTIAFALYAWTWRLRNPAGETVKPVGARSERAARAATVARVAPLELQAISKRAVPGLVGLRCRSGSSGLGSGSGFFVAPDLVLTSAGALCPSGERVRAVLADGRELRGETAQRDGTGLALVRFPDARSEPLALGDASVLRAGDRIVAFEEAAGRFEARQGVVAELARSVFGVGFLRIEPAPASGLDQGSPILDGIGRVVGIVSAPPDPSRGPGFVLPVNYVYSGSPRLIDPPTRQRPDAEGWNQYLIRVLDADRGEVQRFISEVPQPALLALDPSPSGSRGLVATFLRHAVDPPEPQVLRLTVRTPERDLCQASAYVLGWNRVDPSSPGRAAAGSRYFQWLRANDLLKDAYQGFGTLDLGGCPEQGLRGAELVLDGADERADRIRL